MRAVLMHMQDAPNVLKGGTARAIAYDLDRHSTDVDSDVAEPIHVKKRVRDGLSDAGLIRPWRREPFSTRATRGHFPGFR